MRPLAKNSIMNVIYQVANLLFPMITSMYVSRILMPDGVGQVSYAQNIVSYFVSFAAMGLPTYGVREIAKAQGDSIKTNAIFSELFLINFISTLISTIAFLGLIISTESFLSELPLYLSCGLQIILNFINIDWFYQGKDEYAYIAVRSIVIKACAVLAIFVFVRDKSDYVIYALISSMALAGNYIFNVCHATSKVKLTFHGLQIKRHLKPLSILALTVIFASLYNKVDITMLGIMTTDANVGYYSYGHRVVDIVITMCSAATAVFFPRLSYYYQVNRDKFSAILDLGLRVLMLLVFPACLGLFILAPQIVRFLYGIEFMESAITIRILTVLVVVKGFGDLATYRLVMAVGMEKKRLHASFIAGVSNIIMNVLLIPLLAQNGAAIASVVSELAVNLYLFSKVRRTVAISVPRKDLWQTLTSTMGMGAVVVIVQYANLPNVANLLLSIGVGVLMYAMLNVIQKNELCMNMFSKVKRIVFSKEDSK